MSIKTGWQDAPLAFCNLAKAFKRNTICESSSIQSHNHLVHNRTLNYFAKLANWLTCVSTYLYGIHLNFRYRTCFEEGVLWYSGNYGVHIHYETRMWHDNNIQDLYFPEAIKIVATTIHCRYYLMAYGKWRPIMWYMMINIAFCFSA